MRVTKVEAAEVLGATVGKLPVTIEDRAGTELEEVNESVEVATAVELTSAVLLGVLEGVETGG